LVEIVPLLVIEIVEPASVEIRDRPKPLTVTPELT
jgi:hypothetical protein